MPGCGVGGRQLPCGFAATLGRRVTRRPQLHRLHNNKQAFEESLGNFSAGNMRQREHLDEATVACWVTFSGEAIRLPILIAALHLVTLAGRNDGLEHRAAGLLTG
jgi:hypothetical protein